MKDRLGDKKIGLASVTIFILIGLVIGVVVALIATVSDKKDAQTQIKAVLKYVNEQCIRYKELADEEITRSLIDVSDCAVLIRNNLNYLSDINNILGDIAKSNNLNGIIVTEKRENGSFSISAFYSDGTEDGKMWEDYIESYSDVADTLSKSYSDRLTIGEFYYDFSFVARSDKRGSVLCYKRQRIEDADDERFTLVTLLKGFVFGSGGCVYVTDGKTILASNVKGMVGTFASNAEVVRKIRQEDLIDGLIKVDDGGTFYGIKSKCKDLFIYAYLPEYYVFSRRSTILPYLFLVYTFAVVIVFIARRIILHRKQAEQDRIDEEYKKEKERLMQEAIQANEAKTDFLRRMSHDIRTPINGIRGLVKIGEYYADDLEKQKECRAKIWTASDYLLELVNDVLYMKKLSTCELEWKDEKFCLSELLKEVDTFMGAQTRDAGLVYISDSKKITHDYIFGGKTQLKRIFTNLIGNAIKYNKPNGSINVSCEEVESINGYAAFLFVIADTGIGMNEEFIKKMYEPFERENHLDKKSLEGVGLGLSIVKKLVDTAVWELKVDSKKGEGTTFSLLARFKTLEKWSDNKEIAPVNESEKLKGLNILVAEDNELNYEIVEFMLKVAGAKPIWAKDGNQAIQIFGKSRPGDIDVILMDVMMPETDGLAATKAIRKMVRNDSKSIPIIAMTASMFEEDIKNAAAAGMNAHIAKPIDADNLIDCILRLTAKGRK